jgi:hypothetical protein
LFVLAQPKLDQFLAQDPFTKFSTNKLIVKKKIFILF